MPAHREADGSQTFYYMCELKNCQMCNVNGNVLDKLLCDEIMNFNKLSTSVEKNLYHPCSNRLRSFSKAFFSMREM